MVRVALFHLNGGASWMSSLLALGTIQETVERDAGGKGVVLGGEGPHIGPSRIAGQGCPAPGL